MLGSPQLGWHDLHNVIRFAPTDSPLYKAYHGAYAVWAAPENQLLAQVIDHLAIGNWQRQGDPNAPRPEPYPRPGVDGYSKHVGAVDDGEAYDIEEMGAILGLPNTPTG